LAATSASRLTNSSAANSAPQTGMWAQRHLLLWLSCDRVVQTCWHSTELISKLIVQQGEQRG
jgi:hypothetical protein